MLAKFFIVAEDEALARKWEHAELYVLGRDVFRKILSPDAGPLRKFWGVLSDYSHASILSLQNTVDLREPDHRFAMDETLVHMEMVLQCGFHVLNSHLITRSMAWYSSYYRQDDRIPLLRSEIRAVFRDASATFNRRGRALVRTFRRNWVIDESPTQEKLRYTVSPARSRHGDEEVE